MPLSAGTKVGSYEILALIGAGGMGEVWKARDTNLDREVAIKVLPPALAQDSYRLARFAREAKVLASLNHPNIATIHGVAESDSTRALVMELVEGNSPKGPLPFDEAWKIASQIIAALEYAHERGIMHRDLKPANIMITPDGVVKLLDFGLAKAFSNQREPSASPENSPTLTLGATDMGVILGTAAYMAPEQARGKAVDKRADIWSFGVVLYELLTGERLFSGEDTAETLAAVIHKQPDLAKVPRQARRLLEECLQKDPKQRLRDIGDAKRLLGDNAAAVAAAPVARGGLPWIAAVLLAIVAAALGFELYRATRPVDQPLKPLVRLDVNLGSQVNLGSFAGADAVLSPDGMRLAYVSQGRLYTRRLDQPEAKELLGTTGGIASPFFSPDGQWIAFFSQGKLKKISVEGGAAIVLCDADNPRGGSWGEDGYIIAALHGADGLWRIPSAGGAPSRATELAQGDITHRWPQVLSGGKAVLFTDQITARGYDEANIEVVTLNDHRRKTIQRGGTFGRYLPSGHVIYINKGTLFAVPFDLDTLTVKGTPVPVVEEVGYLPAAGSAQFDFSRNGTLVYRKGISGGGLVTVQWLDSEGKTQPVLAKPGNYRRPRLSPDGQRLAVTIGSETTDDIWVYELRRDVMTRVTFSRGGRPDPVWTPDGRFIIFSESDGIAWTRADGGGKPQLLTQSKVQQLAWSISPDGRRLAFMQKADIWTVPVESDGEGLRGGKPEVFLQTPFDERHPSFSSDGRWVAYASDESGSFQVYVRAFPDRGGKWQISNDGGLYPVFSRNGRDLFFRTEDNRIMAASYTVKADSFIADKPRVWSEKRLANVGIVGSYDPAPDGKRIAGLMPVEDLEEREVQSHVIFLQNFFDEVRRRTAIVGK